jgi:hypothetical protein
MSGTEVDHEPQPYASSIGRSLIWSNFKKNLKDEAICNDCANNLKVPAGSTTTLERLFLFQVHQSMPEIK